MWIYKQHYNVYLKAMLELIKWAPRRAQISLDLCCSQVGLGEFNSGYSIPHNEQSDLAQPFFSSKYFSTMDCYKASKLLVKMTYSSLPKKIPKQSVNNSVKSNYCYFH